MRHQVGRHGPTSRLKGEVVDVVIGGPAGDVDDGPGRGPAALCPHLGHRGRWQLAPAPGPAQAAQQEEPIAHRSQDSSKALRVKAAVGGQTGGPGQGRGVLRHAEELDEAGSLDVGVHEDRTAAGGQAVGEGGGDRRAPGSTMRPPHQDDPPSTLVTRRPRRDREHRLRCICGGRLPAAQPVLPRVFLGSDVVGDPGQLRRRRPALRGAGRLAPQLFEPGGLLGGSVRFRVRFRARFRRSGGGGAQPVGAVSCRPAPGGGHAGDPTTTHEVLQRRTDPAGLRVAPENRPPRTAPALLLVGLHQEHSAQARAREPVQDGAVDLVETGVQQGEARQSGHPR